MRRRATLVPWLQRFAIPLLSLLLVVFAVFVLLNVLVKSWPPMAACTTDGCKEAREWISSTITVIVIIGGISQYRRAQQWKRAEFVAAEMKSFFALTSVQKALLMVDWGARRVNLFDSESKNPKEWPLVTRRLQSDALLPHPMRKGRDADADSEKTRLIDSDLAAFSQEEVAIRDIFDVFLDGFERLAGHLKAGLIAAEDIEPYLLYWIDDIASPTTDNADGEWACSLLAYIAFYRYSGVQTLFSRFGYDITPQGELFAGFLGQVSDQARAEQFRRLFRLTST